MQNACEKLKHLQPFQFFISGTGANHDLLQDLVITSIKNHWSGSQTRMTVHIMHVGSAKS